MAAGVRFTATFKAANLPSTMGNRIMSTFFFLATGATDADGLEAARAIEALQNATLVSVTRQTFEDTTESFADAKANGGSDRSRVLFRNSTRDTDNITLPLLRHDLGKAEIEGVFESGGIAFVNRRGDSLGQVVNHSDNQVVDGVAEDAYPPA